jgi:nucleoside diphosphate kinase
MSSGPIVAAVLKRKCGRRFQNLIGSTNPAEAAEGTIRKLLQEALAKMLFTVLILMRMLLSKRNSTFQERDFLISSEN